LISLEIQPKKESESVLHPISPHLAHPNAIRRVRIHKIHLAVNKVIHYANPPCVQQVAAISKPSRAEWNCVNQFIVQNSLRRHIDSTYKFSKYFRIVENNNAP